MSTVKTKITEGVFLNTGDRSFTVEAMCYKKATKRRFSVVVKRTKNETNDSARLEAAIKKVVDHYNETNRLFAIGTIVRGREYSIPGLCFIAGRQGKDKSKIVVKLHVHRKGRTPFSRSASSYETFRSAWPDIIEELRVVHDFDEIPTKWNAPPSELFYSRLQVRLIAQKLQAR